MGGGEKKGSAEKGGRKEGKSFPLFWGKKGRKWRERGIVIHKILKPDWGEKKKKKEKRGGGKLKGEKRGGVRSVLL